MFMICNTHTYKIKKFLNWFCCQNSYTHIYSRLSYATNSQLLSSQEVFSSISLQYTILCSTHTTQHTPTDVTTKSDEYSLIFLQPGGWWMFSNFTLASREVLQVLSTRDHHWTRSYRASRSELRISREHLKQTSSFTMRKYGWKDIKTQTEIQTLYCLRSERSH